MARIALQGSNVLQIASISQLVEVDDGFVALRQPVEHEIRANETGASSY